MWSRFLKACPGEERIEHSSQRSPGLSDGIWSSIRMP
jgi:hypothetical protein